jgi:WD40 repeat protein
MVAALTTEGPAQSPAYFRTVAQLGIQAAEALEHAHQLGVVHRDVKPGNLLLDGRGNLWVTDFGLARLPNDPGLTLTGDLIGTLRYMSPEQALAQRVVIDHRTDVYSLGATLYELLTMRPVFEGRDRQELLRQIAFEEPKSPRRWNKAIPVELETIIPKALEKNPAERYATAQELADDLKRFLDDHPIRARRPTVVQRLRKWGRRHRALVMWVILGLTIAVLGLIVSTALIAAAYQAENKQRNLAEKARGQEANQRRLAERRQQLAQQERDTAKRRLYVAHMLLAKQAWDAGQFDRVKQLLQGQVPVPGQPDLRGWEWHYLQALCHRPRLTIGGRSSGYKHVVVRTAWSPDSRLLATAGNPRGLGPGGEPTQQQPGDLAMIKVWDILNRQEICSLSGFGQSVDALAWSPDGQRLASASPGPQLPDRIIKVWDVTKRQCIFTLKGHAGNVESMAWSPDGRRLASVGVLHHTFARFPDGYRRVASDSGSRGVKVWDVIQGHEVFTFKAHDVRVSSATWSPDGRRLASPSGGAIQVWDTTTGKEIRTIRGYSDAVWMRSVAWSPDGRRLVGSHFMTHGLYGHNKIKVWEAASGQEVFSLSKGGGGAWSPNGRWLATRGENGVVKVWDAGSGQEAFTLLSDRGGVETTPVWTLDGRRLAAGGNIWLTIWDTMTKEREIVSLPSLYETTGREPPNLSPNGQWLITPDGSLGGIQVWDATAAPDGLSLRSHTDAVRDLAWCPKKPYLATASDDKTVKVWDATTGQDLLTLRGHKNGVHAVAWSPDGRWLATGDGGQEFVPAQGMRPRAGSLMRNRDSGTIRVWNVSTGQEVSIMGGDCYLVHRLAFSPDGKRLASAGRQDFSLDGTCRPSANYTVKVWDPATGRQLCTLKHDGVRNLTFSPDGNRLISVGSRGTVKVWDPTTGQEVRSFQVHSKEPSPSAAVISPDGKRLATAGVSDKTVKVWDTATGKEERTFRGSAPFVSMSFSPDGKRLAGAAPLKFTPVCEVKLWDLQTGQEVFSVKREFRSYHGEWPEPYSGLAFSVDGNRLALASRSSMVVVLDAAPRAPCLYSHTEHPQNRQYRRNDYWVLANALARDYHEYHEYYGPTRAQKRDHQQAEKAYRQALSLQRQLVNHSPRDPARRHELALLHMELGGLLADSGQLPEAVKAYKETISHLGRLVKEFPKRAVYLQNLCKAYQSLVPLFIAAGRHRETVEAWSQVVLLVPESHENCNGLAWFLATCPDRKIRNHRRAVELASKAVVLLGAVPGQANSGRDASYPDTLGVAYYRAGNWKAATATLELLIAHRFYVPSTRFFLAMAYWQLGAKEKARQMYNQAVLWMEKHQQKARQEPIQGWWSMEQYKQQAEELRRFRAEAAALLGIKDPPRQSGKDVSPSKK